MDANFSSLGLNDWFFVLFDASTDALIVTDYEFNIIHANPAFCNLSDHSKEAIDQMNFNAFLNKKGKESLQQLGQIKQENPNRTDFRLDIAFKFDSSIVEIPTEFSLLPTAEGTQAILIKLLPKKLSAQQVWEAYFEQSSDHVWVVDPNYQLLDFSKNQQKGADKIERIELYKGLDIKNVLKQRHKDNWIGALEESMKKRTTVHLSDTYKTLKKTQHVDIEFIPIIEQRKVLFTLIVFKNSSTLVEREHQVDRANRDLTALTLRLTDKKNFIKELDKNLELLALTDQEEAQEEVGRIRRQIATELRKEEDADTFDLHFRKIHPDFFKKLSTKCPSLTQNELKHCAYIRMNLSNKEVSSLLHVMPRTIEIARYRIKKKLGLTRQVRLKNFINSL